MANRFLVGGGTGNWDSTTNWAATSGGASGASFPVAGDVVAFDSNSGTTAMTVNVASACASLVVSGTYTGTLTFNAVLTLTSTLTFISGMTLAGSSGPKCTANATLTSGGKVLTGTLEITGSGTNKTYTLADDWTVTGLVTLAAASVTTTINGQTIFCKGGLTIGGNSAAAVVGTTAIKITDTGTIDTVGGFALQCALKNALTIDASGKTITFNNLRYGGAGAGTGVLTYVAGDMVTTGSTLVWNGTLTMNTGGMTWGTINQNSGAVGTVTLSSALHTTDLRFVTGTTTFVGAFDIDTTTMMTGETGGAPVLALTGNITCSGLWTEASTTSFTWSGAFDITAGSCTMSGTKTITLTRDIVISGLTTSSDANVINGAFNWKTLGLTTTGNLSGTATLVFNGTGTWTGAAGVLSTNCTINTAGTLTVSGTCLYATNTLTYTAGTVTGGGTISCGAATTIAGTTTGYTAISFAQTGAMTFGGAVNCINFTVTAVGAITINGLLTCSGTITLPNTNCTFNGTAGFTCATLTNTTITATRTYNFKELLTYTITTAFITVSSAAQTVRFVYTSSHASDRAYLTLQGAASQDVGFADPIRIDSSGGQTIFSYHGVLTDTINWNITLPTRIGIAAVGHAG